MHENVQKRLFEFTILTHYQKNNNLYHGGIDHGYNLSVVRSCFRGKIKLSNVVILSLNPISRKRKTFFLFFQSDATTLQNLEFFRDLLIELKNKSKFNDTFLNQTLQQHHL